MPVINGGVVLNPWVTADPCRLRHLAEDVTCLQRLHWLAAYNGACLPRAVGLNCLHELVVHAHRVVAVLEEDGTIRFAREAGVIAGLNECPRLLLFVHLGVNELHNVRVLHVKDHHLCGASGLTTRLHDAREGVEALHERDGTRCGAAATHLLLGASDWRKVGTCAGSELEEHRLSLGEVHDGRHGVLYAVDEACGALWSRLNTNVEPDWRVERHLLIDKQVRQLCNECSAILF